MPPPPTAPPVRPRAPHPPAAERPVRQRRARPATLHHCQAEHGEQTFGVGTRPTTGRSPTPSPRNKRPHLRPTRRCSHACCHPLGLERETELAWLAEFSSATWPVLIHGYGGLGRKLPAPAWRIGAPPVRQRRGPWKAPPPQTCWPCASIDFALFNGPQDDFHRRLFAALQAGRPALLVLDNFETGGEDRRRLMPPTGRPAHRWPTPGWPQVTLRETAGQPRSRTIAPQRRPRRPPPAVPLDGPAGPPSPPRRIPRLAGCCGLPGWPIQLQMLRYPRRRHRACRAAPLPPTAQG